MSRLSTRAAALREAADNYIAEGWRVLLVDPKTKAPVIRGGVHAATDDPTVLARWLAMRPDALLALATGDRVVVVDVDPRNGGTMSPDWPATLTARTRGGGWHLYYAAAGP